MSAWAEGGREEVQQLDPKACESTPHPHHLPFLVAASGERKLGGLHCLGGFLGSGPLEAEVVQKSGRVRNFVFFGGFLGGFFGSGGVSVLLRRLFPSACCFACSRLLSVHLAVNDIDLTYKYIPTFAETCSWWPIDGIHRRSIVHHRQSLPIDPPQAGAGPPLPKTTNQNQNPAGHSTIPSPCRALHCCCCSLAACLLPLNVTPPEERPGSENRPKFLLQPEQALLLRKTIPSR